MEDSVLRMTIKLLIRVGMMLLVVMAAQQSMAQCSVAAATSPATVSFGTFYSNDVSAGNMLVNGSTAAAAHFSITCAALLNLGLLSHSGNWLSYRALEPLVMAKGAEQIAYVIASNSQFSPMLLNPSVDTVGGASGFQLLSLGLLTGSTANIPLFFRTRSLSQWPSAGVYTGTQRLHLQGRYCTGVGIDLLGLAICLGWFTFDHQVSTTLNITVAKRCAFNSASALVDFGSISFVEEATTKYLDVAVRCNAQEDFILYADNGEHSGSGVRHMQSASGGRIAYQIMQPASLQPLNKDNPVARIATGYVENLQLPVMIVTGQNNPRVGSYSDRVRMVIEY